MKNKVLFHRNRLQLTQAELAEKSGVSLRTIQRVEAGTEPKGFTLKALAQALNVTFAELIEEPVVPGKEIPLVEEEDIRNRLKLINSSALLFIMLPFSNIFIPAFLIYRSRERAVRKQGRDILSLQILWTLLTSVLLLISPFLQRALSIEIPLFLLVLVAAILLNLYIILRNAWELDKKGVLYIRLTSSIL